MRRARRLLRCLSDFGTVDEGHFRRQLSQFLGSVLK